MNEGDNGSVWCADCIDSYAWHRATGEWRDGDVSEIENSNFNPDVIAAVKSSAQASGYVLTVTPGTYDTARDITSAEVELTYTYKIPLLGVEQTRTTKGIAR